MNKGATLLQCLTKLDIQKRFRDFRRRVVHPISQNESNDGTYTVTKASPNLRIRRHQDTYKLITQKVQRTIVNLDVTFIKRKRTTAGSSI